MMSKEQTLAVLKLASRPRRSRIPHHGRASAVNHVFLDLSRFVFNLWRTDVQRFQPSGNSVFGWQRDAWSVLVGVD